MATTAQDVLEHLRDYLGGNPKDSTDRDCKRAILEAYREFADAHAWSYLYAIGRLNTVAPYSTGTVAYTSASRALTLSGGTWPSWAAYGNITIANVVYAVATRDSDTVLTLDATLCPSADITSGTAYVIYRNIYDLPADFRQTGELIIATNWGDLSLLRPGDWAALVRRGGGSGDPAYYTIIGSPKTAGRMAIGCYPYPSSVLAIDFMYQRRPRALVTFREDAGTVTNSAGSAAVTGSGTAFTSNHVGSIIRFSPNGTQYPAPLFGSMDAQQVAADQEVAIAAYTSATAITTSSAVAAAHAGTKFIVSDPIDIEDGAMLNAFLRCCEKHVAINRVMKDRPNADAQYAMALQRAKEANNRSFAVRRIQDPGATVYYGYREATSIP